MSWNLITFSYGSKQYYEAQLFLSSFLEKHNVNSYNYDESYLKNTKFYEDNKNYLRRENKYGWCAWKPFLIIETMKKLKEGDKIVLCDVDDIIHPYTFSYVDEIMGDDPSLFVLGGSNQKMQTKRDCFVFMDCDEEDYWDSVQLEAGITFWRVCEESKQILSEWLNYCLDERINGEDSNFSGKENFKEFTGWSGKDQSILTNIAIKYGLSVDDGTIRNYIECNAGAWYDRYLDSKAPICREIDVLLLELIDICPYINRTFHSIVLTVHNKEFLLDKVLNGIQKNTIGEYELIIVLDGCIDRSCEIVEKFVNEYKSIPIKVLETPDIYETKANNVGIKEANGEYVIIVQDDMVIDEIGWNRRLEKPFNCFDDVFAVTARTSHNWIYNKDSKHIGMSEDLDDCYCDILIHCDHADKTNVPRDTFAVRGSVNRGPLMIKLDDLKTLNYLDEEYAPLDMDDHDLMFRARKELNKVCGCYWINYQSENEWGGTRINGSPAPWYLKSQHKNVKIFYDRYKDFLDAYRIIENRKVS
jgi:glycosyltransferase involved in cell wall biosynthesis